MTTLPIGNEAAHGAFAAAMAGTSMHHAWLFAGPEGIGKASFARIAALALLAGQKDDFHVSESAPARSLIAAGSHPDYRELMRLPKDAAKPDGELARSISIAQVRALHPMFGTRLSAGTHRVVLIDAIDDLERGGANALLKMLEEPPQGTIFLLVSHAPGRLLPTIRSRCRLLRFDALAEHHVATVLRTQLPEAGEDEVTALATAAEGSPGRAIGYAGLDLAQLDEALATIARDGDVRNERRSALAKMLSLKAAQPRYEAFLDRAPAFIARAARDRRGEQLRTALDAYDAARSMAGSARALSLDAQGTVFEMAGLVARLSKG